MGGATDELSAAARGRTAVFGGTECTAALAADTERPDIVATVVLDMDSASEIGTGVRGVTRDPHMWLRTALLDTMVGRHDGMADDFLGSTGAMVERCEHHTAARTTSTPDDDMLTHRYVARLCARAHAMEGGGRGILPKVASEWGRV